MTQKLTTSAIVQTVSKYLSETGAPNSLPGLVYHLLNQEAELQVKGMTDADERGEAEMSLTKVLLDEVVEIYKEEYDATVNHIQPVYTTMKK